MFGVPAFLFFRLIVFLQTLIIGFAGRLLTTFSIRIVADRVALSCQNTRKLERVTNAEITHYHGYYFYTLLNPTSGS